MRRFKTILCPTDFSEDSYRALAYADRFAEIDDGTILLTHVVHVPTENRYDEEGHLKTFDQMKARALQQLEVARAERLNAATKCELVLDLGVPFDILMRIATERNCDLIVVCTHGRTGFQGLVMGSVAEKIVRHSPCPVFVVRRGTEV